MAIGHPDALREEVPHGWQYSDEDNQALHEALQFLGASLPQIDEFIEQLEIEGAAAGAELRLRRRAALKTFRGVKTETELDGCAFVGHIEWILLRIKAIRKGDFVQPYIDEGIKKRLGDKNRTRQMVDEKKREQELNKSRYKEICQEYLKRKNAGGASVAKAVARVFDISPKTVYNIWARRDEYLK